MGCGRYDVVGLPLNFKNTKRLIPLYDRFKNRKLSPTSSKRSTGSLERHFTLYHHNLSGKKVKFVLFSISNYGHKKNTN